MAIDLDDPVVKDAIAAAVKAQVDEATARLKTNRDEILNEKKKLEKRLKDLEGIDPEEHKKLKAEADEAEKKKAAAEGNWKALEGQLVERHSKELGKRDERIKTLTAGLERELIDAAATRAIAAEGGKIKPLLPHVRSHMKVIEEDGAFVAVVIDEKGNPRIGEKAGTRMSAEELVRELKADAEFAGNFAGSGSSGGGASGSQQGGGAATRVLTTRDPDVLGRNVEKIASGEITVQAQ